MELSIIIPVYNVESYIEKCLLSVLNQSNLNDTEIIIVDDCGTDNSMDVVKKIVSEYSNSYNIKIVSHTQNQGLSAARNTGIIYAKGDYVFFLDSDDELPENTIRTFGDYLYKYKDIDFFVGNYIIDGPFNGTILNNEKKEYDNNEEIFNAYIENQWYVMACGKFIRRNFLVSNSLLFPVRRLHEDEYFSFKLALCAKTMVVINENVYMYKIRANSITTKKKRKNYIDYFWIISQQIEMMKNSNIKNNFIGCYYLTNTFYNYFLLIITSSLSLKEKKVLLKWSTSEYRKLRCKVYSIKQFIKSSILSMPLNILYMYIYMISLIFYKNRG